MSSTKSPTKTKITKNLAIDHAIAQVEHYITEQKPKNYSDIKKATNHITKAALCAYLSVHTIGETLDFINHLAHIMINDNLDNRFIPPEYRDKIH